MVPIRSLGLRRSWPKVLHKKTTGTTASRTRNQGYWKVASNQLHPRWNQGYPVDQFRLVLEKAVALRAGKQPQHALQHHRHPDRGDQQRDRPRPASPERRVERNVEAVKDQRRKQHRDWQYDDARGDRQVQPEPGEEPGEDEADERAHRHHVAMREMREAQDPRDQRHPHRTQRVDRADDEPGDHHFVDDEDDDVHGLSPPAARRARRPSAARSARRHELGGRTGCGDFGRALSAPQKAFGHFGVGDQLGPGAREAVLPLRQNETARRQGQRLARVLLDH